VFAGKVGTGVGFTQSFMRELRARLDRIEQKAVPFAQRPAGALGREAHWVRPALVAEVAFAEWTTDGRVRHASFQGFRQDMDPQNVRREMPLPSPADGDGAARNTGRSAEPSRTRRPTRTRRTQH
jgi:bifunctional non-homologous end joining protein LigD